MSISVSRVRVPGCSASAIRVTVPGKVRSGHLRHVHHGLDARASRRTPASCGTKTWVRITLLCMIVNMKVPLVASACTRLPMSMLRWVMTPSNGATTR